MTDNSDGKKEEKSEQYISTRRSKAPIKTKQLFQAEKRPPMTFSKPKDFSDRGRPTVHSEQKSTNKMWVHH